MERGLKADFAFIKAWKGDKLGNLVYRKTARNFNPMMATAAKITIAEVEHIVEVGELFRFCACFVGPVEITNARGCGNEKYKF